MNSLNLEKINIKQISGFRFKEFGKNYLLTNEVGDFAFLNNENFIGLIENNLNRKSNSFLELKRKKFIKNNLNNEELIKEYRNKNKFLWQGPALHIIVLTLRCNHKCVYCQSSAYSVSSHGVDMERGVAKKTVDTIFDSPSQEITIEFQGGEPLVNWETLKFIVRYALTKNKIKKKNLSFTLVSNFSLLNNEKLNFLIKYKVLICTSLDGPKYIHDKNRRFLSNRSSYDLVVSWINKINKINNGKSISGALCTITKHSLPHPKNIVDEYIKHHFNEIHLRPLSFLGFARLVQDEIGYSPADFIDFYSKALEYIIELNLNNKSTIRERTAKIFLSKILKKIETNFYDLRSPCGAGIGQMLYNFDGRVFTCDEARMINDDSLVIGNIRDNKYKDLISHENVAVMVTASCLEGLTCEYCVYKPYCGVCPVLNLVEQGNIFTVCNFRCQVNKGILDYLFTKIREKKVLKLFNHWLDLN